jgi:hypothetical protein
MPASRWPRTERRDDLAAALELANLRYDAGRTSFLEVLDAQRTLLAAETCALPPRAMPSWPSSALRRRSAADGAEAFAAAR